MRYCHFSIQGLKKAVKSEEFSPLDLVVMFLWLLWHTSS